MTKTYIFLFILLVCSSCTSLDREAEVTRIQEDVSLQARHILEARGKILYSKQSLKIGLMKLNNKFLKMRGKALLVDAQSVAFHGLEKAWTDISAPQIHGQLIPEFYRLIKTAAQEKMILHFICKTRVACHLIRNNLSESEMDRSVFHYKRDLSRLSRIKPEIVVGHDKEFFQKILANKDPLWEKRWIYLPKMEEFQLSPDDWARVVPTIKEF